jgi:hypothetical protein
MNTTAGHARQGFLCAVVNRLSRVKRLAMSLDPQWKASNEKRHSEAVVRFAGGAGLSFG